MKPGCESISDRGISGPVDNTRNENLACFNVRQIQFLTALDLAKFSSLR